MSPNDNYFDWVNTRKACSLEAKFGQLNVNAKKDADRAGFEFESNGDYFMVYRPSDESVKGRSVTFKLENDRILVGSNPASLASFTITLTLNDEGDCRYRIDNKGEHKCWQVLRRALEQLFFDSDLDVFL